MMSSCDKIISKGLETGFEEVELYYGEDKELELGVFEGTLDKYSKSSVGGTAVRGIKDGKTGIAFTEKTDDRSLISVVISAYENAGHIDSTDICSVHKGNGPYEKQELFSDSFGSTSIEEKMKMLFDMEKSAFSRTDKLYKVGHLLYGELESEEMICNSKALYLSEKRNIGYIYMDVIIKDGEKFRSGTSYTVAREYTGLDAGKVVTQAVEDGISKVGARSIISGGYTVIFRNRAFADLLSAFAGIFAAERVQKGTSKLAGKLGSIIADVQLTVYDDPNLKDGLANAGFDAEGVKTAKKEVVQKGRLKTYLYNIKTALKDGVESTGNAGRSSYSSAIGTRVYNFYIEPGMRSLEQGIESIGKGVLITDLQGLHAGVNQVSCDFSLSAQGFMIEDGKTAFPVSDITVSGNFLELLKRIRNIYSDLDFTIPSQGCFGSPSVEIDDVSIAGEAKVEQK